MLRILKTNTIGKLQNTEQELEFLSQERKEALQELHGLRTKAKQWKFEMEGLVARPDTPIKFAALKWRGCTAIAFINRLIIGLDVRRNNAIPLEEEVHMLAHTVLAEYETMKTHFVEDFLPWSIQDALSFKKTYVYWVSAISSSHEAGNATRIVIQALPVEKWFDSLLGIRNCFFVSSKVDSK
jgi:hypothetical protein